jgi:hypothetical protein
MGEREAWAGGGEGEGEGCIGGESRGERDGTRPRGAERGLALRARRSFAASTFATVAFARMSVSRILAISEGEASPSFGEEGFILDLKRARDALFAGRKKAVARVVATLFSRFRGQLANCQLCV